MQKHDVKRGVIVVFLIIFAALTLVKYGQAFGISTPYLENETLKVNPGQSYIYTITIQNGDTDDYYVDINYSSTDNVAELRETSYFVPSNTYNNTFNFDITIPKDAPLGKKYLLEYSARPRVNDSAPLTLGIEIKRSITILVTGENDSTALSLIQNPTIEKEKTIKRTTIGKTILKYFLILIILALIILIVIRIWKLSKGISSKISNEKVTNYTISEAINLAEVERLLEKMSDDEFTLQEIKSIFKDKISELTTHNLTKDIRYMSRKEAIEAINKLK